MKQTPVTTIATRPIEKPNKPKLTKSMTTLAKNPRIAKSAPKPGSTKTPAPTSLAAHATYGEKHRATEILAQIVASGQTDTEAFTALDEGFTLIERIRLRVGR